MTVRCRWFRPVSRGGCDNRACLPLWIPMSLTAGVWSSPKQALVVLRLLTPTWILAVFLRHRFRTLWQFPDSSVLTAVFLRSALGDSPLRRPLLEARRLRSWGMVCFPSAPGLQQHFPMIGLPFRMPTNTCLSSVAFSLQLLKRASTISFWMAPSFPPQVSGHGLSPLCCGQLMGAIFDGDSLVKSSRIARARFRLRRRPSLMCWIGWSHKSCRHGQAGFHLRRFNVCRIRSWRHPERCKRFGRCRSYDTPTLLPCRVLPTFGWL